MQVNTLILGAGAAGLYAAAHAGPGTLVIDHARAAGEKIRISGGGRCNFTNRDATAAQFISANPHFAKSALARHTPADFVALVTAHGIGWHEKALGQLFCDRTARDIIAMLTGMVAAAGAQLWLRTTVGTVTHGPGGFTVALLRDGRGVSVTAQHLIVATGGKSIPKMGATGLAYQIAAQFGLPVTDTRPALVPFTFAPEAFAGLAGVACQVSARAPRGPAFDEAMLFTHRGLSGPALLQASSYWREGEALTLSLARGTDLGAALRLARRAAPKRALTTVLSHHLPARLVAHLAGMPDMTDMTGTIGALGDAAIDGVAARLAAWTLRPTGTEGYRTAEVTLGGVDTDALSARTMMARAVPGLFFIGECVDVTGWLGGYNFQWAWSSGFAAGTAIAAGRAPD